MARLDIPIILIDESVVDYGFRVLMSGYQPEGFEKNPILLLQHKRPDDWGTAVAGKDLVLPLGKWYDIQVTGSQLVAKPEFDDDDELAVKVEGKVKKGYLNAASVWIEPIEVSDDENLKLPGQFGPTITKWGIRESSIVDIPNCRGALAIRNSAGNKIVLNGGAQNADVLSYLNSLIPQSNNMDKKLMAVKLGLPESATDQEISTKLAAVMSEHSNLTTENTRLKGEVTELSGKIETANKLAAQAKNEALVDGAIAAKKIPAGDREKYLKLAAADFATTKELIDSMKSFESLEGKLGATGTGSDSNDVELQDLLKLSGRDLYLAGKLQRLKDLSETHFKLKYKEYFGQEPK